LLFKEEQDKVEKFPTKNVEKLDETKAAMQIQFMVLPTKSSDDTQIYVLKKINKQGHIQLLDNNAPTGRNYTESGTRTIHRPQFSRGGREIRALNNIIVQFENNV